MLDSLKLQFEERTHNYSKQITEKFCLELLEKFRPKIRMILCELVERKEKELEEVEFLHCLDNMFFDLEHPTDSFKQQAQNAKLEHIDRLASLFR